MLRTIKEDLSMLVIDIYKDGDFVRYKNIYSAILQKSGILEIFFKEDGEVIMFQPEEFDWFTILLK